MTSDEFIMTARRDVDAIAEALGHAFETPDARGRLIERITDLAHDIKTQGAALGYRLIGDIAQSLYAFCRLTPDPDDAQLDVVRAHVDAIRVVVDDGGDTDPRDKGDLLDRLRGDVGRFCGSQPGSRPRSRAGR